MIIVWSEATFDFASLLLSLPRTRREAKAKA